MVSTCVLLWRDMVEVDFEGHTFFEHGKVVYTDLISVRVTVVTGGVAVS